MRGSRHYAALQAIALSEEEVSWDPEKDDTTRYQRGVVCFFQGLNRI